MREPHMEVKIIKLAPEWFESLKIKLGPDSAPVVDACHKAMTQAAYDALIDANVVYGGEVGPQLHAD